MRFFHQWPSGMNYLQIIKQHCLAAFVVAIHILQTDGYKVYDIFDRRKEITQLCCWAHARRYFFEAQKNDAERSPDALSRIQRLYSIEQRTGEMQSEAAEILSIREKESIPILNELPVCFYAISKNKKGFCSITMEQYHSDLIILANPNTEIRMLFSLWIKIFTWLFILFGAIVPIALV